MTLHECACTLGVYPCKVCSCLPKRSMELGESSPSRALLIPTVFTCQHAWDWLPPLQGRFTHFPCLRFLFLTPDARTRGWSQAALSTLPFCNNEKCIEFADYMLTYNLSRLHSPKRLVSLPLCRRNWGTGRARDFLRSQRVTRTKFTARWSGFRSCRLDLSAWLSHVGLPQSHKLLTRLQKIWIIWSI